MDITVKVCSPVSIGPMVGSASRPNWLHFSRPCGAGRALGPSQVHLVQYRNIISASSSLGTVEILDIPTFDDVCLQARERSVGSVCVFFIGFLVRDGEDVLFILQKSSYCKEKFWAFL